MIYLENRSGETINLCRSDYSVKLKLAPGESMWLLGYGGAPEEGVYSYGTVTDYDWIAYVQWTNGSPEAFIWADDDYDDHGLLSQMVVGVDLNGTYKVDFDWLIWAPIILLALFMVGKMSLRVFARTFGASSDNVCD